MVTQEPGKSNFSTPVIDREPRLVGAQTIDPNDGGQTNVNGWQMRAEKLERENTELRERLVAWEERAGQSASALIDELVAAHGRLRGGDMALAQALVCIATDEALIANLEQGVNDLVRRCEEAELRAEDTQEKLEEAYKAVSVGSRLRHAAEQERDQYKRQYADLAPLVEYWRQEATERQKEAIHLGADRQLVYALLAEFVGDEPSEAFREQASAIVAAWRAETSL